MKVFNPEDASHTLLVIPSEYVTVATLLIRDELLNETEQLALSCSNSGGFLTSDFEFTFREGASYEIELQKTDKTTIYRGKAYATIQSDAENYKYN